MPWVISKGGINLLEPTGYTSQDKNTYRGFRPPKLTDDESSQGLFWTQDGLRRPWSSPVWRKVRQAASTPDPAPAPAPAPVAAPPPPPAPPSPSTAPGNPALSIPGVDVRLTGENLGIKSKNSSARISGKLNKGTSRLTIPRSSGANSLNLG